MFREFMPKVHGGILEKLEGENYKIIVDDAFKWLKTYKFVDVFIFIFHKKKNRGTFFFFFIILWKLRLTLKVPTQDESERFQPIGII